MAMSDTLSQPYSPWPGTDMCLALCINTDLLLGAEVTTAGKTDSAPAFTSFLFLGFPQLRMKML